MLSQALALLAEAAWNHEEEGWAKRAKVLVPDLESRFTPPCHGEFARVFCDEYHQHTLKCFDPAELCMLCGTTNREHRAAWEALE